MKAAAECRWRMQVTANNGTTKPLENPTTQPPNHPVRDSKGIRRCVLKNMLNHPADVKRFSNEFKFAIVVAPNRLPFCGRKDVANASVCANNLAD